MSVLIEYYQTISSHTHFAAGLWNVLTLGLASSGEEAQGSEQESPLASLSVLLLLVLTNHYTADRTTRNPYRQALLHAQNFHGNLYNTSTASASRVCFHVLSIFSLSLES